MKKMFFLCHAQAYQSPRVEVIEVNVEQGISASWGATEGMPETPANPW
ncbi:MAG: hypothetical protein RSF93_07940 [Mucinivorans sp.]